MHPLQPYCVPSLGVSLSGLGRGLESGKRELRVHNSESRACMGGVAYKVWKLGVRILKDETQEQLLEARG